MPYQISLWLPDHYYNYLFNYKNKHTLSWSKSVLRHIDKAEKYWKDTDKVRSLQGQVVQMEKAIAAWKETNAQLTEKLSALERKIDAPLIDIVEGNQ